MMVLVVNTFIVNVSSMTPQNSPIPRDHGGGGAIESNNIFFGFIENIEM